MTLRLQGSILGGEAPSQARQRCPGTPAQFALISPLPGGGLLERSSARCVQDRSSSRTGSSRPPTRRPSSTKAFRPRTSSPTTRPAREVAWGSSFSRPRPCTLLTPHARRLPGGDRPAARSSRRDRGQALRAALPRRTRADLRPAAASGAGALVDSQPSLPRGASRADSGRDRGGRRRLRAERRWRRRPGWTGSRSRPRTSTWRAVLAGLNRREDEVGRAGSLPGRGPRRGARGGPRSRSGRSLLGLDAAQDVVATVAAHVDYVSVALGASSTYVGSTGIVPPPPLLENAIAGLTSPFSARRSWPRRASSTLPRPIGSSARTLRRRGMMRSSPIRTLPRKAREGLFDEVLRCIGCNACIAHYHAGTPIACTQNPRTGRERTMRPPARSTVRRRVVVVGGGPAGLAAAAKAGGRPRSHAPRTKRTARRPGRARPYGADARGVRSLPRPQLRSAARRRPTCASRTWPIPRRSPRWGPMRSWSPPGARPLRARGSAGRSRERAGLGRPPRPATPGPARPRRRLGRGRSGPRLRDLLDAAGATSPLRSVRPPSERPSTSTSGISTRRGSARRRPARAPSRARRYRERPGAVPQPLRPRVRIAAARASPRPRAGPRSQQAVGDALAGAGIDVARRATARPTRPREAILEEPSRLRKPARARPAGRAPGGGRRERRSVRSRPCRALGKSRSRQCESGAEAGRRAGEELPAVCVADDAPRPPHSTPRSGPVRADSHEDVVQVRRGHRVGYLDRALPAGRCNGKFAGSATRSAPARARPRGGREVEVVADAYADLPDRRVHHRPGSEPGSKKTCSSSQRWIFRYTREDAVDHGRRVVEVVVRAQLAKPADDDRVSGRSLLDQSRIGPSAGTAPRLRDGLEDVAGRDQLGQDNHLRAGGDSLADRPAGQSPVALEVADRRRDLCAGHAEPSRRRLLVLASEQS